jgi:hypothetical protein
VATEAVFLTSAIDARERRHVATLDIPGAFMQADIDELIFLKLDGTMATLLADTNPGKFQPYMTTERGQQVIYLRINKALYGTLHAALLFWKNLSSFLVDNLGFTINPHDK